MVDQWYYSALLSYQVHSAIPFPWMPPLCPFSWVFIQLPDLYRHSKHTNQWQWRQDQYNRKHMIFVFLYPLLTLVFYCFWLYVPNKFSPPSYLPSSSPLHPHNPIQSSSILFWSRQTSNLYQPGIVYQVSLRLGTSSCIKAGRGSLVGGIGPNSWQQSQRHPLLSLLGVSHKN